LSKLLGDLEGTGWMMGLDGMGRLSTVDVSLDFECLLGLKLMECRVFPRVFPGNCETLRNVWKFWSFWSLTDQRFCS
jgi:hypothetical protein